MHVARRLGYLTDDLYAELTLDIRRAAAPLIGMIRAAKVALDKKPVTMAERRASARPTV